MPNDSVTRIEEEDLEIVQLIVDCQRAMGDEKTQLRDVIDKALSRFLDEVRGE